MNIISSINVLEDQNEQEVQQFLKQQAFGFQDVQFIIVNLPTLYNIV